MQETIIDIQGYEELYRVSSEGYVLSLPKGDGNGKRLRVLKPEKVKVKKATYLRVTLSKQGKIKRFSLHRLVAQHFLPNPENKPQVNHIDNDPTNNRVSNLEWCTGRENMKHSADQGRQDECRKLGCEEAQRLNQLKAEAKFSALLGDQFISTHTVTAKNSRRFVMYKCKSCSQVYTAGSRTHAIQRGGICNPCSKEEDIV